MTRVEGPVKVCPSCSGKFVDRSRTSPRTYCESCSPLKAKRSVPSAVVKRPKVEGVPFTIEHFQSWSAGLVLVSGEMVDLDEFEVSFVADLFDGMAGGWLKEAWLIVPEGNGKSTLISMLILYCVEFAREASIPVAASSRDQANIINTQASGFVRRTPGMAARFVCKPGLREIVFDGVSKAKIFASDAGTGDGIIPYPLEVIDELHRHKTLELYRTWAGKLDKEDAVLVVISTAGEPGSEFEDVREVMRQGASDVRVEGCFGRYVGSTSILHEYAVPEAGDMEDLALVKAANPSSRITVETLGAKRARPSWSLPHWQRLTCNRPTRSVMSAIAEAEWFAAATAEPIPDGEEVWVGLDLGLRYDTTALVPLWMRDLEFRMFGPATILTPPGGGEQLNGRLIEAAILEIHARNPIHTVVMDPTRAEMIGQWVEDEIGARVVDRQQTLPLQVVDYSRFMEALREGWLHHSGDAGLTRHVLNAVGRVLPRGDVVFERPHESRTNATEQIRRVVDALDAAAMVHSVAVAELEAKPKREARVVDLSAV